MCGIAGLIFDAPIAMNHDVGRRLSGPLSHRGPDDHGWCALTGQGVLLDRCVAGEISSEAVLVHRRLSILDLTEAGRQPMGTRDGRYFVVYNGEIYNFLELRSELESVGCRFHSRSDTEVLLNGYAQWGLDVLHRLTGMFAFAILDVAERKLLLSRDFFGIKPLYYTFWRDGFAFASELKPLLNLPGVSRSVNPRRLYEYLRSGLTDQGGETLFTGIYQLPTAHYLELSIDRPRAIPRPKRYWEIDLSNRCELSFAKAAEHLRDLFLDSVRLHLRSDVPVGAALSGGIDSSSIVMAMRRLSPDQDIHTFSYMADDPALNEERWVDIIGANARTVVHKVTSEPEQLVADLEHLVDLQGEPFASTSIYSQQRVFQAARAAGIKVMLDGQGADELLGGYDVYAAVRLASLLRRQKWQEALLFWHKASKLPKKTKLWQLLGQFLFPPPVQAGLRHLVGRELWPAWMNRSWFDERGVEGQVHSHNREDLREALQRTLAQSSLPMLLRYEDRNSMACSIESRVPFLTPQLAGFVLSLPEEYIIAPNGTSKAVFREAMRGIVPDAILNRSDKIGFETPEKRWLCSSLHTWVDRVLNSEETARIKALDAPALKKDWQAVLSGRKRFDSRVWRWVNLAVWTRLNGVHFD
jgi:asparagine synthase (glutamine-hydrolysing)